jgi:pyridinium-3,5-bisthiocarboxylic acid mononucleotide nickel chelatase
VTPTGAALVRTLSSGPPPSEYVPLRSGFGAGTKDFRGRANALRVILADASTRDLGSDVATEELVELVCDIDDMTPEYLAAVADRVRDAGALDVTLLSVAMKRGRPGSRIEVLCRTRDVVRLEEMLLVETTTIGVRQRTVRRRALAREVVKLTVLGHEIAAKLVTLPTGRRRAKPEFVDVQRVALATGRPLRDISSLAAIEAERYSNA